MSRPWTSIAPADAKVITLPAEGISGPVNEMGEPCPWPWEPQQLVGAPMGQFHCSYCGGMQMAGMPHLDWSGEPDIPIGPHALPDGHPLRHDGP